MAAAPLLALPGYVRAGLFAGVAAAAEATPGASPDERPTGCRLMTADLAVVEAADGFELAHPEVRRADPDPEPGRGLAVRQAAFQSG